MDVLPDEPRDPGDMSERNLVLGVYALYLSLLVTGGIGVIVGLIVAFVKRNTASTVIGRTHLAKQVRLPLYAIGGVVVGILLVLLAFTAMFYLDLGNEYDFLPFLGMGVSLLSVLWFLGVSILGISRALSGRPA